MNKPSKKHYRITHNGMRVIDIVEALKSPHNQRVINLALRLQKDLSRNGIR